MNPLLPDLLAANAEYQRAGFSEAPRAAKPSGGLVVLTCMDARIDVLRSLGLELGQAHVVRNAGGRASDDAIRSLVVSTHLLGTREIGVIQHTGCGLGGTTDADIAERTGVAGITYLAFADAADSVRSDVETIRSSGHFPEGVVVWGAVYDVDTGALEVMAEPAPAVAKSP